MDVIGVTSAQHSTFHGAHLETVNGTDYHRTRPVRGFKPPLLREWRLMRALRHRVREVVQLHKPDVIHAHSPVIVGLPALQVARKFSLPFVYEVRDLWENASVDRGKFAEGSLFYKMARNLESHVLKRADAVVTICEKLREEIAPRLGRDDRLFVVGNGVDATKFSPRGDGQEQKRRRNLAGKKIIGYIGTFQPYEGLDVLVTSMTLILKHEPNAHLVITGSGGVEADLRAQARESGLDAHVTFTGRVSHHEVSELYAMMDILVYPRILTRTTALTTPLKPLEAMAMGKPVIVSDVGAMRELIQADVTGSVFRVGDPNDLASQVLKILQAPESRLTNLGNQARDWILRERQWSLLVSQYTEIYDKASHLSKMTRL